MTTTNYTPRYHHDPRAYRAIGGGVAADLAAIADHLHRVGTPDADLVARLDALTDAMMAVKAGASAIRGDLDAAGVIR